MKLLKKLLMGVCMAALLAGMTGPADIKAAPASEAGLLDN